MRSILIVLLCAVCSAAAAQTPDTVAPSAVPRGQAAVEVPPGAAENPVINPIWTKRPDGGDLVALYPRQAHGATGHVTARCLIDEKGRFAACGIVREAPQGVGFADATMKLATLFQMKLKDAQGRAVAGRMLYLPVVWRPG